MVDKAIERRLAAHVAQRITQAIAESGKSQEAIGAEIGVSKPAVSKWRKLGKIKLSSLWQLAEATGKPMAWFFPGFGDADAEADQDSRNLSRKLVSSDDAGLLEDALFAVLVAKRSQTKS